jgi:hypothetical protein
MWPHERAEKMIVGSYTSSRKPKNKEKIKTKLVGLGQWFENYNQEKPTFISKSLGHGSY